MTHRHLQTFRRGWFVRVFVLFRQRYSDCNESILHMKREHRRPSAVSNIKLSCFSASRRRVFACFMPRIKYADLEPKCNLDGLGDSSKTFWTLRTMESCMYLLVSAHTLLCTLLSWSSGGERILRFLSPTCLRLKSPLLACKFNHYNRVSLWYLWQKASIPNIFPPLAEWGGENETFAPTHFVLGLVRLRVAP